MYDGVCVEGVFIFDWTIWMESKQLDFCIELKIKEHREKTRNDYVNNERSRAVPFLQEA